jgi:signal transduction histidine kinase
MFSRIVQNILSNSAEASASGGTKVVVTVTHDERMVQISFDDNGSKIPEAVAIKIRAGVNTTTKANGSGLGLSQAKEYVESRQGAFWVGESPLGGTRVLLSLPLQNT